MMGAFEKGQWVRVIDNEGAARFYTVGEVCQVESVNGTVKCVGKSAGMYSYRFEAWKPKVGDRVRYKNPEHGKATVIEIIDGKYAKVDTHGEFKICTERFSSLEPIPAPAEPTATLTISAGRYYKTRDGRKVGPIESDGDTAWGKSPAGYATVFVSTGLANHEGEHNDDFIAEWVDEPATIANDNAAPAKFKVGDRVRGKDCLGSNVNGIITKVDIADDNIPYSIDGVWCRGEEIELITPATTSPTAIVALIEDGVAKPATKPRVHASQADATAEAERLALLYPGEEFGVFVLADSKIADVVEEVVKKAVLRAA